jgi:hypothetical protein
MTRRSILARTSVCLGSLLCASALFSQSSEGYLRVKADPGRAGVFLDGKYLGPARNFGFARRYTVPAGEHELRLEEPRYEPAVTRVTVTAKKTTTVSETLKPLPAPEPPFGMIRTDYPDKFAAIFVNGKFYGHAGEYNNPVQGLLVKPGEYTVKLVPVDGGEPREEKVTVEANKTSVVRFTK